MPDVMDQASHSVVASDGAGQAQPAVSRPACPAIQVSIGGSEIADVLSLDPYWCRRRLWYRLTGTEPDDPELESPTAEMRRGADLEDYVARRVASACGWRLRRVKPRVRGIVRASPDRIIVRDLDAERPAGVLECKVSSSWVKAQESLDAWRAQVLWYLAAFDKRWGAIAILTVEDWRLHVEIVERDAGRERDLLLMAFQFAVSVQSGDLPPAPAFGARCWRCAWRRRCQGDAGSEPGTPAIVDDIELAEAARRYDELRALASATASDVERARGRLIELLAGRRDVVCAGWRITFKSQRVARLDVKSLERDMPDVAARYKRETESEVLYVRRV